jgi:DNA-binding PadR family transcriptional regulator
MSEEDNENADSNKKEDKSSLQLIWNSLSKNYNLVEGAQLSNSFVILLSLIYSNEHLTTNQISEIISKKSKGEIYKNPGTIKDALDKRLVREGFVSSNIIKNKTKYAITSKGEKLLKGWIGFLSAITNINNK